MPHFVWPGIIFYKDNDKQFQQNTAVLTLLKFMSALMLIIINSSGIYFSVPDFGLSWDFSSNCMTIVLNLYTSQRLVTAKVQPNDISSAR